MILNDELITQVSGNAQIYRFWRTIDWWLQVIFDIHTCVLHCVCAKNKANGDFSAFLIFFFFFIFSSIFSFVCRFFFSFLLHPIFLIPSGCGGFWILSSFFFVFFYLDYHLFKLWVHKDRNVLHFLIRKLKKKNPETIILFLVHAFTVCCNLFCIPFQSVKSINTQ